MYAPGKFKRTSERKVIDPTEEIVAKADRRAQAELQAFESIRDRDPAGPLVVEPLDLSDKGERLVDLMLAEDESRIDLEGRVYP